MKEKQPRLSHQTLKVLHILLEKPLESLSGSDLAKKAKIGSGTLYPMLTRLEDAKWLSSEWEDGDPSHLGRPRKRFYKLTGLGQSSALCAFDEIGFAARSLAWNFY